MITELEKQFFDTFGIEKKQRKACVDENTLCPTPEKECEECSYYQYIHEYPQIEDKQYLELMCLYTKDIRSFICVISNLKLLKEEILEEFISEKDGFNKHQVQAIFKESE